MRIYLVLSILALGAAAVLAQEYVPGGSERSYIRTGYGYGGGYGYGHASTEAEGVQRGFADVVRSAGAANLMNSAAAKNYEDARKKYIENRLQATETYFEMRRVNEESRDAKRPRPLSTEQYVRLARQQAPERLSVSQLDPLSGTIDWPAVLARRKIQSGPRNDRAAFQGTVARRGTSNSTKSARRAMRCSRGCSPRPRRSKPTNSSGPGKFVESLAERSEAVAGSYSQAPGLIVAGSLLARSPARRNHSS